MYPEDFDDVVIDSRAAFEALSAQDKVAWCIHRLEAEVNNGGFYQFFSNATGAFVRETVDALSAIGAQHTKTLLQRAIETCFPRGYPEDSSEYENHLVDIDDFDEIDDEVDAFDTAFLRYVDPLTDLVNGYLSRSA